MSSTGVPPTTDHARGQDPSASRLTRSAFLMPLTYVVWFWVSFAFGYLVTDVVGAYPSVDPGPQLNELGIRGFLGALVWGVLFGLPAWLGVWLAARARRRGGGSRSLLALGLNLVLAIAALAVIMLG